MANRIIQIKRGPRATMPELAQGELGMTTDSGAEGLHIGTGTGENIELARVDYVDGKLKAASPDWNQNDDTAPDYIKNRPFYSSDPIETVLVDNVVITIPSDNMIVNPFPLELVDGAEYSVTWNGVEYRNTCSVLDNGLAIGNRALIGYSPDTDEPFLILVDHDDTVLLFCATAGSVTMSLSEFATDITKIDKKYLPILVGEDVTGREFVKYDQTLIAGEGAEIFNDYKHNAASGEYSHAEGTYTHAHGDASHAEGGYTYANGSYTHAEGFDTCADGSYAHAEGRGTEANGKETHAEGYYAKANGVAAHAEGSYTIASGDNSHAQGRYNIEDTENVYQHIVGNGGPSKPSNAHTLDWDGNAWFSGDVYVGSTSGTNKDDGSVKLVTVGEMNTAISDATGDIGAILDAINGEVV